MPNFLVTEAAGEVFPLARSDGGSILVRPAVGTGSVTTVTATAPVTSTGGATPNIALTSPSRAYGDGTAATLSTTPQTVADATIVPSNTGKLQIAVWCAVQNSGESVRSFALSIQDGAGHVLIVSGPVTVFGLGGAAFSVTIDSDLATGTDSSGPQTYPLGVPVTINLVLVEQVSSSGLLTVALHGSGVLVKENVV